MKIRDAIPNIFQKAYPVLDPKTPMLSALPLLRFQEIDALPLAFDAVKTHRAIFGFTCLARLMQLGKGEFTTFLKQPCEEASEPLTTIAAERSLGALLDAFARTRLGFARVEERRNTGALVSLADILTLFGTGTISTELAVRDVASRIFDESSQTTIKKTLDEMFSRRFRRVFIKETKKFVWDRGIIDQVFSPAILGSAAREPREILGRPISELQTTTAQEVDPDMDLRDAARALAARPGQCLVFDGMLVTPWDVVMKPWKSKALDIR